MGIEFPSALFFVCFEAIPSHTYGLFQDLYSEITSSSVLRGQLQGCKAAIRCTISLPPKLDAKSTTQTAILRAE